MLIVVIIHPLLRRLYDSFWRTNTYTNVRPSSGNGGLTHGLTQQAAADTRMEQRISFDFGFALLFLAALHGFSALKILLILYINYQIATALPKKYVPLMTWVFNIGILFANELGRGYPFASIFGFLSAAGVPNWGATLDQYGGLVPRWEVLFNVTVLRLIAFDFDYYWSLDTRGGSPIEVGNHHNSRLI